MNKDGKILVNFTLSNLSHIKDINHIEAKTAITDIDCHDLENGT